MADVEALEQIMVDTPLIHLLSTLPSRSSNTQVDLWRSQKDRHSRSSKLLWSLGKTITTAQARRLDELGFTFESLNQLRSTAGSAQDFQNSLHSSGVKSKPLREKLTAILH